MGLINKDPATGRSRPSGLGWALLGIGGVVALGVIGNLTGSGGVPVGGATEAEAAGRAPAGMAEWRDPSGLSIMKPPEWKVEAQKPGRVVAYDPARPEVVIVSGVRSWGDLRQWLSRDFPRSETWIASATVIESSSSSPGVANASFRVTDRQGQSRRMNVAAVRRGDIATIFLVAAPPEDFDGVLPKLTTILSSVRLGRPVAAEGGGGGVGSGRYVRWTEPREGAFSAEIPEGWRPEGGVYRPGLVGAKVMYTITSPDNAIQIFAGDQALNRRFIYPSQVVCSMNACPGPMSNGDYIDNFAPATRVIPMLLQGRFGQARITGGGENERLAAFDRQREPVMGGARLDLSVGEAQFALADGRVGYAFAKTSGQPVQGLGGAWYINAFHGFVAQPGRAAEGAAALAHLLSSSQVNPRWFMGELGAQAQASQQYMSYFRESQALQAQTVAERWHSQDQIAAGRGEGLSGTTTLVDPRTNERITAQNDGRFFYRFDTAGGPGMVSADQEPGPSPVELRRLLQMGKDIPYQ